MILAVHTDFNFGASTLCRFRAQRQFQRRARMYAPTPLLCRRHLLDLNAAASIADRLTEDISAAIERGAIQYAWNIATEAHGKLCVRVLVTSLAEYLSGQPARTTETPAQAAAVVANLFPALAETIRMDTFARVLGCTRPHVQKLVNSRVVELAHKSRGFRGDPTLIYRRSAIEFLMSRRIR
jgi:hypothetical protein